MTKTKNEMIPAEPTGVSLTGCWSAVRNLAEAIQLAEIVAKSVAIPDVRNAGQALVKILCGAEMGFGPFASLVDVHIIEGKPAIGAKLMAAAIKRSGVYDYQIRRLDAEACELEFFRNGKTLGPVGYSMAEADAAGVSIGKGGARKANWQKHPDDMLFARAVSKGFRRHCPDLCGGVVAYDPDELDNGQPADPRPAVDAEFTVNPAPEAPAEPEPTHFVVSAVPEEMVDRFAKAVAALKLDPAALKAKLVEKYGVDSYRKLTAGQAEEVLSKMEERVARPS